MSKQWPNRRGGATKRRQPRSAHQSPPLRRCQNLRTSRVCLQEAREGALEWSVDLCFEESTSYIICGLRPHLPALTAPMPWGDAPPQPPTAKTDACASRHSRRSVLPNARAGPRRPLATQTPYPPTTTHIGRNLHQLNRLMPCRPLASHQKPYHETCSCTSQNLRQEMARSRYGSRPEGVQHVRNKRRSPLHACTTARSRHRCCRCGCHRRRHGRYRRCRRSAASAAAVAAAKPLSLTSPSSPPSPLPLSRRCRRHIRA